MSYLLEGFNMVYILFEAGKENDLVGVYSSESYAESDAIILNLKN